MLRLCLYQSPGWCEAIVIVKVLGRISELCSRDDITNAISHRTYSESDVRTVKALFMFVWTHMVTPKQSLTDVKVVMTVGDVTS